MMTLATLCNWRVTSAIAVGSRKLLQSQNLVQSTHSKSTCGISTNGRTELVIFEGIMDASLYLEILKVGLLPFLRRVYPNGHCFMQDNNPKHTSAAAREFFAENSINWWKTPPESPDANPIENLWHELKEFVRREVKPKTKQELIEGIHTFWARVDIHRCRCYIGHLRKVLPKIIEVHGDATGY